MATIKVAHNASDAALARIEAVVEKTLNYDCNWIGAEIRIERDEFTSVECSDDIAGAQLLAKINAAIEESEELETATITVTWSEISGEGRLIARCDENPTYASNVVRWENPIDASTDSWAIAHAVTSINGAEIIAVDHERDTVLITVNNATVDA